MGRGTDAQVLDRTRRFIRTVPQVTGQFRNRFVYADLRHPDGYALRLQGVSTTGPVPPARKSP
jgi:cell division protein FtsQ